MNNFSYILENMWRRVATDAFEILPAIRIHVFRWQDNKQKSLIFSVDSPTLSPPHTHDNGFAKYTKRRNVLTDTRVNFSQSETSPLLRGRN